MCFEPEKFEKVMEILDEWRGLQKLFRWAAAVIEYAFLKRPMKEIVPLAKEIYRSNQSQGVVNQTMNYFDFRSLADMKGLLENHRNKLSGQIIDSEVKDSGS